MRTVIAVAWAGVLAAILILSFAQIPSERLPESVRWGFGLGHVPAYGVLAALTLRLLMLFRRSMRYRSAVLATVVATMAVGGLVELLQPAVGRTSDWADIAMNAFGMTVALVCMAVVRGRRAMRRSVSQLPASE
ncbi:MAG: VanZ family protein [Aquisalimonadaceae bacterium]